LGPRPDDCRLQGRLAEAYGDLLQAIWGGKFAQVDPISVTSLVEIHAPGLLSSTMANQVGILDFLLSGLHEDLNRVVDKPLVEEVGGGGWADEVAPARSWDAYKRGNDSIIADLCAGLSKSHVKCSVCDLETTKFEPYLSVSVPAVPIMPSDRFFVVSAA
jgi:ubiquitin C-terminal hydrolase